jgi:hypothetical protein
MDGCVGTAAPLSAPSTHQPEAYPRPTRVPRALCILSCVCILCMYSSRGQKQIDPPVQRHFSKKKKDLAQAGATAKASEAASRASRSVRGPGAKKGRAPVSVRDSKRQGRGRGGSRARPAVTSHPPGPISSVVWASGLLLHIPAALDSERRKKNKTEAGDPCWITEAEQGQGLRPPVPSVCSEKRGAG